MEFKQTDSPYAGTQAQAMDELGKHYEDYISALDETQPTWYLVDEEGKVEIVVTPFMGKDSAEAAKSKALIRGVVSLMLVRDNILRYVFVSEAWTTTVKKEDLKTSLPPSQSEQRREVLVMVVVDGDGTKAQRVYEIMRSPENLRSLKLLVRESEATEIHGEMTKLFEQAESAKEQFQPGQIESLLEYFEKGGALKQTALH